MLGKTLKALFVRVDRKLDCELPLLLLLLLLVFLRIPNFFEPYWYGDEAIYLTIGNALNKGELLYRDIIDHKTPLIYYLARVPDQVSFRFLLMFWMIATTILFYQFAKKFFVAKKWAFLSSLLFLIFSSLPWLEGNIPNGELFVMGFILLAGVIFQQTEFFRQLFIKNTPNPIPKTSKKEASLLFAAGSAFALGTLTKVPALLDFAAFLFLFALSFVIFLFQQKATRNELRQEFLRIFWRVFWLGLGFLLPILLSILYFASKNALGDYFDYGLLYNLRYSQEWQQDFGSPLLNFLFSLPGKTIVLLLWVILLFVTAKKGPWRFHFFSLWFFATLYSVLLSSRPYPHYFLQSIPPLALLLTELTSEARQFFQSLRQKKWPKVWLFSRNFAMGALLIFTSAAILLIFGFKPYPTLSYYQRFAHYATGKISKEEYDQSFDALVKENNEVTALIHSMQIEKMFIWGTNPTLYAESKTLPTSRFTVSFHIKDFNDYERTFAQISAEQPELIIVMKNETTHFPQLESYLQEYYRVNSSLENMSLYWRIPSEAGF